LALGLLLALPTLSIGFFSDDWVFVGTLEHRFAYEVPWWDLYRFTPVDADSARAAGYLPWWTAPGMRLHLVRPLASMLLTLDHAAFGRWALGYHLHSLVWYAILLIAAWALFRRLLPRATACLALLVFTLSNANSTPFGWISARHGLLTAAFSAMALTAHVRAREEGWSPGRRLAPIAVILALVSGESGLAAIAFGVAYELLGAPGSRATTARDRAARAAPWLATGLVYLALYAALGGGARDSAGYVSPLSDPARFLAVAATRVPVLLASAIFTVPAELAIMGVSRPMAIAGVVGTVVLGFVWRAVSPRLDEQERRVAPGLAAGALASIVATSGGFPGSRELIVADLGIAPLLAILLRHAFASGSFAIGRRAVGGLLVLTLLVLGPLAQLSYAQQVKTMDRATATAARDTERELHGSPRAYMLVASDPMVSLYVPPVISASTDLPRTCWGWVSGSRQDVTLQRTGPSSFSLQGSGPFLRGAFEALFRDPSVPLHVGETFPVCTATVRIGAMEDGLPSRLDIQADEDLDAPRTPWLAWVDGAVRAVPFPPVGKELTIRWSPGPMGMF
jgi:hypothetical protein